MINNKNSSDKNNLDEEVVSLLGNGSKIEGDFSFSENLVISGTFNGTIVSDGHLVIMENATVSADITVSSLVIKGKVSGNIVASEIVEIREGSSVIADLKSPRILIEENVNLHGTYKMVDLDGDFDIFAKTPEEARDLLEKKQAFP